MDISISQKDKSVFCAYTNHRLCKAQLVGHGTGWCVGGQLKGKQANGVGIQYALTRPLNRVYSALLPMTKSWNMLPNIMESHELGIKIKESLSTSLLQYTNSFHIIIQTQWPVDTVSSIVYSITVTGEWTNFFYVNVTATIWRFRCVIIFVGIDYESVYSSVHLVLSVYTFFFHSFYMSPDSSLLFFCHSSKILLCQLLYISELKCNIFCSYSALHRTTDFFCGV